MSDDRHGRVESEKEMIEVSQSELSVARHSSHPSDSP